MQWSAHTLWWIATGTLVVAELASGTFYLLMIALGTLAGALAAHAGLGAVAQIVVAALVGSGATALWHWTRARGPAALPPEADRDVVLDIGQTVLVRAWHVDGTAQVHYRGAAWGARYRGAGTPVPGPHRIVAFDGNRLVVEPA